MCLAFFALALSGMFGFSCFVNRLNDFRGTAKRAGHKSDAPSGECLVELGQS